METSKIEEKTNKTLALAFPFLNIVNALNRDGKTSE